MFLLVSEVNASNHVKQVTRPHGRHLLLITWSRCAPLMRSSGGGRVEEQQLSMVVGISSLLVCHFLLSV